MTNKKDLSIKTATITIKVMQVDGHKLTMATYRQFKTARLKTCGAKILEEVLSEIKIIGWVNDCGRTILLEKDDEIVKLTIALPLGDSYYDPHRHHCKREELDSIFKKLKIDQIYIAT